jgi:hypothetical protein
MAVRTTVDIPESLHAELKHRSAQTGVSIRSLVVRAIEVTYREPRKGARVTGPLVYLKKGGKRGPAFPTDENPHDLVFS